MNPEVWFVVAAWGASALVLGGQLLVAWGGRIKQAPPPTEEG